MLAHHAVRICDGLSGCLEPAVPDCALAAAHADAIRAFRLSCHDTAGSGSSQRPSRIHHSSKSISGMLSPFVRRLDGLFRRRLRSVFDQFVQLCEGAELVNPEATA